MRPSVLHENNMGSPVKLRGRGLASAVGAARALVLDSGTVRFARPDRKAHADPRGGLRWCCAGAGCRVCCYPVSVSPSALQE